MILLKSTEISNNLEAKRMTSHESDDVQEFTFDLSNLLAQRPPFLFIDEVQHYEFRYLRATRFIDPSDYYFEGHFPGEPIVPGAILIEMMAQACGILVRLDLGLDIETTGPLKSGRLASIQESRFFRSVIPGETVTIDARRMETIGRFQKVQATVRCRDVRVAVACLVLASARVGHG